MELSKFFDPSKNPNRNNRENRIVVGNNVFIIDDNRFYERKEQLCSEFFIHQTRESGQTSHLGYRELVHFWYKNDFIFKNKLLSVEAKYYSANAPSGDRVKLKATYDGVCIGDFGLLRSSIGAGTRGIHPEIKNEDWLLIFKLNLNKNDKGFMHFYVEYYERISEVDFHLKSSTAPAVEISETIVSSAQEQETLEKQTVLHCRLFTIFSTMLRIHPGTVLVDENGNERKLITTEHISVAPKWSNGLFEKGYHFFTLVFEGLDDSCTAFQLREIAAPNERNLFFSDWIKRNKTDVYSIEVKISD